ncbi:hypothetical protein AVEN_73780-1 [Araneus ventricosus]|uniref:Uncharacterized protein n=1 Tax=Araneus ventricosus TaxID=182803 RepID=A0A4Y2WFU8_ARAVE|nr:hypothetical protein AVEN_73780-1 [Araneus ventricosus]
MRMTLSKGVSVPVASRKMVHYEVGQGIQMFLLSIQVKIDTSVVEDMRMTSSKDVVFLRVVVSKVCTGFKMLVQQNINVFHNAIFPIYRRCPEKHSTKFLLSHNGTHQVRRLNFRIIVDL